MTTLLDRQKEFVGYLVDGFPEFGLQGLHPKGAYAIVGNGSVENKMNPVTYGPKDHGSDGVLQWRLDRLTGPRGLQGWAAKHKLSWQTLRTQAAFTLWELEQPRYAKLQRQLREGELSIDELTAEFCWEFERPNRQLANLPLRQRHARSVAKIMGSGEPPKPDPKILANAKEPVSTVFGIGSIIAGVLAYLGEAFPALTQEGWAFWVALGVFAIFFYGRAQPQPEEFPPEKEGEMERLIMLVQAMEKLLPFMTTMAKEFPKVVETVNDIPALHDKFKRVDAIADRLQRLEKAVEKLTEDNPELDTKLRVILNEVGKLGDR